jgi:hypothetical protein
MTERTSTVGGQLRSSLSAQSEAVASSDEMLVARHRRSPRERAVTSASASSRRSGCRGSAGRRCCVSSAARTSTRRPSLSITWRVTFVDRHGHDHSSPRGRRSAWTVRVAEFRIPKALMIDSRLGPNVQMVSAGSTVGVRSSADIATPARRPPGRGRACGRVGGASASRQLRLRLPGALVGQVSETVTDGLRVN